MQETGENELLADTATFVAPAEPVSDLFASDFFALDSSDDEDEFVTAQDVETISVETQPVRPQINLWHAALPKISRAELKTSGTILDFPVKLTDNALRISAEIVSQCVLNDSAKAVCEFVSSEEVDFEPRIANLELDNTVFVNFAVEPKNTAALIALDFALASAMVRTAFGSSENSIERRDLSQTELAVIEFFALCFFGEINKFVAEPLFRIQKIEQNAPIWLRPNIISEEAENPAGDFALDENKTRGLSVKIRLQMQETTGIVELLLTFKFLESLSEKRNPLLARQNGSDLAQLKKVIAGAKLRVYLGETRVEAADLAALETGDVVLIESAAVSFRFSELFGAAQIRIADETAGGLFGELTTETGQLRFKIGEIAVKNRLSEPTRVKMDENQWTEDAATGDNNGLALEKVTVTIAIEIASRRLNLEELAGIRVGQIIELGTQATDPVELVADGKTLAIGELIDIEGSLGVRLTRVLL